MFNNEPRGTGSEKVFNWICFNNFLNYNNYSKNNWLLHISVDEDMKQKIQELRMGSTNNELIKQNILPERQLQISDVSDVEKVVSITIDSGADIEKATSNYGNNILRFSCTAHNFNLVVQKSFCM